MALDRRGRPRTTGDKEYSDRFKKLADRLQLFKAGFAVCKQCGQTKSVATGFHSNDVAVLRPTCRECNPREPWGPEEWVRSDRRHDNELKRLEGYLAVEKKRPMPKRNQFILYMYRYLWCHHCRLIHSRDDGSFEPGAVPGDRCVKCLSEVRQWTRKRSAVAR